MIRPRLGLLLVTSGWFREVGLQEADSALSSEVERTAAEIVRRVSAFAEPVGGSVLYAPEAAQEAGREIAHSHVDGVLLVPLAVRVLDPQQERPAPVPGQQETKQRRPGAADVQMPRRRWGKTGLDSCGHLVFLSWHGHLARG